MRLWLSAAAAALITLAACGGGEETAKDYTTMTAAERARAEPGWIVNQQEAFRTRLKDPASAQFRNSRVYHGSGVPVVCGEVNAKNGFGGYSGFTRFITAGSAVQVMESDMAAGEMDQLWSRVCR